MSRFTRRFASASPLRLGSMTLAAATFVCVLAFPGSARAQALFQPPSPNLTTGTTPQGVAAADFARAGWVGMVVADSTSNNVEVFLGTGPNTFNSGTTYYGVHKSHRRAGHRHKSRRISRRHRGLHRFRHD